MGGRGAEAPAGRGGTAAGGSAQGFACDVASSAAVEEVARAATTALGPVDVLANVAGIGDRGGARKR